MIDINKYADDKGFNLTPEQQLYLAELIKEYSVGFDVMNKFRLENEKLMTVYGGSRIKPGSKHYEDVKKICDKVRQEDWVIATGGGPGIMTAALEGHEANHIDSIAYNINIKNEETKSNSDICLMFDKFTARKYFLRQSDVFLIAPGGYGTLDEVMELLTLIQTDKWIPSKVIFYDAKYWKGLIDWFKDTLLVNGTIGERSLELFEVADDIEEAVKMITTK